jgi:glycosyltransferase involved in cell wall biosynthesis
VRIYSTLKILTVSTHDAKGGAARAAYRLHNALQGIGVESKMLVQVKDSDDYTVSGPATSLDKAIVVLRSLLEGLPIVLYKKRIKTTFSMAWMPSSSVIQKINSSNADIVHLHWISGMLSLEGIAKINKPIVWTLHDMWAFTGGCHINNGCEKYLSECGAYPNLGSMNTNDLSALIFKRKKRTFSRVNNMAVIGVSRWLTDQAKSSTLFRDKYIINIPNPINTHTFSPLNKAVAKDMLGFSPRIKIILFGAMRATVDLNKGFSKLSQALLKIKSDDIALAIFGAGQPKDDNDFGFPVHYMGRLYDDLTLRVIYSAADVTVVPSRQESFSQAASESMACGTPVVAFGATGLLDIIEHKQNGYLAKPFDPDDLAQGIDWILSHPDPGFLSQNSRQKVLDYFEASKVARQYLDLYERILEGINPRR